MIKFLDLSKQYLSIKADIDLAISTVLSDTNFVSGYQIQNFQDEFASYVQSKYCLCVANGTDALEIAIQGLRLPPSSDIIVPANSFISSSEAVTRQGHNIVFADVDPQTYNVTEATIRACITPNTKAIIIVHLFGRPCDFDSILPVCREFSLKIIEDCAQAHGAYYKGSHVGNLGDVATFSFYPGKNLGAYGDAGAIVTNSSDLFNYCRLIANHGRIEKYNHVIEGRNSRIDTLQAAILLVKLKHLDKWISIRNSLASQYIYELSSVLPYQFPSLYPDSQHAYHLFVISHPKRDSLRSYLASLNIQTGIHYPISLSCLPAYEYLDQSQYTPVANRLSHNILSLPIGDHLVPADISYIVETINSFEKA
ncbi:perosamine synthetase protein family [Synechococcus sp. BOUM118]|nr:perosamine synthetase protein family [Synechococcus sp. BOUM118]